MSTFLTALIAELPSSIRSTPILKMDYAEKHPVVVAALKELGGHRTDKDMHKYNQIVDDGGDAKQAVAQTLKDAGLIS